MLRASVLLALLAATAAPAAAKTTATRGARWRLDAVCPAIIGDKPPDVPLGAPLHCRRVRGRGVIAAQRPRPGAPAPARAALRAEPHGRHPSRRR